MGRQGVRTNPHRPLTSKGRRATSGWLLLLDLRNLCTWSMFTCIQHSFVIIFLFWYINSSLEWLYTSCYGVATWNHLSSCTMQQISFLSTIGTTFFLCKVFNSIVEHGCHRRTYTVYTSCVPLYIIVWIAVLKTEPGHVFCYCCKTVWLYLSVSKA